MQKLRLRLLVLYTIALGLNIIFLMIRFWPEQFGMDNASEMALSIPTIIVSLFLIIAASMLIVTGRKLHDNLQWKSALYDELFYNNRLKSCVVALITVLIWQVVLWPISHYLSWSAGLGAMTTLFWGSVTFFAALVFLSRD